MEKTIANPSLLPYLQKAKNPFYLEISSLAEDPAVLEKTDFPFLVVIDSDPLSRLLEAKFMTDSGSELGKVFLLVQRDLYLLTRDDLWPMNNPDIAHSWQEAFSFYMREKQMGSLIVLAQQRGKRGELQPLQSLFFCKTRSLFFPPACPQCGLPLEQCYDDGLLSRAGLQPYSTSLKRYLFCPTCFPQGKSDFYTQEKGVFDPPALKDRLALIRNFGQLAGAPSQQDSFPCAGCPQHPECFGAHQLALSRITPFSFYPFFMFIFGAKSSINAVDFLPLISGATFAEIETKLLARGELGRVHCLKNMQQNFPPKVLHLFDRSDKFFGEILYLKLSFLGELIRQIFSGRGFYEHPDLRLSIDRIWVKVANPGTLLPFFWNFQVECMDISKGVQETSAFPQLPESAGLYFLGRLWFYTLLVNKRQDISMVYRSLGEEARKILSDPNSSSAPNLNDHPTFSPENNFWEPAGKVVPKSWHSLWEQALSLGWFLMKASQPKDTQWSEESFGQKLEKLREEVKENLFREGGAVQAPLYPLENEAIQKILNQILKKWQREIEPIKEPMTETVILTPEGAQKETRAQEAAEISETIILSPGGLRREISTREEMTETTTRPPQGLTKETNVKEEMISETIILSPEARKKETSDPEEMSETIILSPEKTRKETEAPSFPGIKVSEDVPETINISPARSPKGPSATRIQPQRLGIPEEKGRPEKTEKIEEKKENLAEGREEDFSMETIFLSPQKDLDKKNENKA